jgi:hypothetical protein
VEGWTVILEVVASNDMWIWCSFFGMADSDNDVNTLHRSPVFSMLLVEGNNALVVHYEINGNAYDKPYYPVDGIYPNKITLVKMIRDPQTEKEKRFTKQQ